MQTLMILAREHAAIHALLERFETEVVGGARRGEVDGEAVDRLLAFFEQEVDGRHQEKEERVFLPRLLARAGALEARRVRALLADHARERELLARLRREVEGAAYGEGACIAALARDARSYVQHQREHSHWEQTVLFPVAREVLRPSDERAILAGFRLLDREWGGLLWEASARVEQWLDQRRAPLPA